MSASTMRPLPARNKSTSEILIVLKTIRSHIEIAFPGTRRTPRFELGDSDAFFSSANVAPFIRR
ncbi:protein of unknown function [Candidatus Filomicrobium marinum]|uniref:Uncharacterized protein n=1 Tax=Candidatus Filomicrobium marinum TaxID=1608628 RepID=A0A0D6JJC9_9HYPH|nr:protein of unknown function [Candidatus Filomicrobium marinum]CPR22089.1 protein of unknown function [Candidatus Filomicrobium marinum]